MNILFIGYRGTGKTTLSLMLAEKLNLKRLESDQRITEYFGLPIPGIVNRYGWKAFREGENRILKGFSTLDNRVFDLGGGVVIHRKRMEELRENAVVICLTASEDVIYNRIHRSPGRPALTDLDARKEIAAVLEDRDPLYRRYADMIVDTGKGDLSISMTKIISFLKESYTVKSGLLARAS